jgi:hypothetical protein
MTSVFSLPHIFIVFNPGSGGNFMAGIVNGLLNSNLQSINIGKDGSSHTLVNKKITGEDFLSFGTLIEEHAVFKYETGREEFYLTNIKKHYDNLDTPQVIWTHDFTNIPLYRKHFKNSKIFVITNNTDQEQLTAIIMHITKTLLGSAAIPLSEDLWQHALKQWVNRCTPELCKLVSTEQATDILANRLDPNNKKILEYVSIRIFLLYYGMLGLINPSIKTKKVFNNVLHPAPSLEIPYIVGNTLETYIDNKCIVLPYNYLANNDSDLLIRKISELFVQPMTDKEHNFIKMSFTQYRNAQDQLLLLDPIKYYNNLKDQFP